MSSQFSPSDFSIPDSLSRKWQSIIDILARTSGFAAALIMRVDTPEIEVCLSSKSHGNPFKAGDRTPLNTNLFCEKVMTTRALVHCPDAMKMDPVWSNPDVDLGMVCYYGIPVMSADGTTFGTICILNNVEKDISPESSALMHLFRDAIEADLARLAASAKELSVSRAVQEEVEDRYAAIFRQAAIGIARVGLDGTWLEVNDKLCSIVGYSRQELMARTFQDITHAAHLRQDLDFVDLLLNGEIATYSLEKRYVHKHGHDVWVLLTVSLVRDRFRKPSYFISVVEDITAKQAQQKEYEQAQKLEAMGRLVGGIAHEFNNKLAAITGNLFLARKNRGNSEKFVRDAEKLCFQASEMIKGLLTYARREHSDRQPVVLNAHLRAVVDGLKVVFPDNVRLNVEISDQPMHANANETQIQQIVINLVNNAVDAVETVPRPEITIDLKPVVPTAEFRRRRPSIGDGKFALLEVGDNGIGVAANDIGKIFDPFFTTKPVGKGTGLGLAMVKSLVQQHGGAIDVDSTPGRGSRFSVYLPMIDDPEAAEGPGSEPEESAAKPATILVVDDNESVLNITSEVLETLGYKVVKARHGAEALGIYLSGSSIDCVLADVVMPIMGGIELWKRLKEQDRNVKMILMTGYSGENVRVADCRLLFKPIAPAELDKVLQEALSD